MYSKTCLKQNLKGPEHFFRLIKVYYDSHGTWKYFRLRQVLLYILYIYC
jgi:hypothetical protein